MSFESTAAREANGNAEIDMTVHAYGIGLLSRLAHFT